MRVMVVDDEQPARERLKALLGQVPDTELCGEAANGEQLLRQLGETLPDVILLDIRMPGMDGIEAARHLTTLEQPPAVIFTTAYGEHALEAFEAQAVGYLLKPVRKAQLEDALQAASRVTRAQLSAINPAGPEEPVRTHVCARVRGGLKLVPISEVVYFQADQKYVTVRHLEGEVLIEESLKQLEQEFGDQFIRVHRNALASLSHLDGLEKGSDGRARLRLRGCDQSLEISRRHIAEVRRQLRQMGY